MEIKIETSARHIHLTKADYKQLFGDSGPTPEKDLSQGDQACTEMVEISGPKSSIKNVRVIIPFRDYSQVEISRTDCFAMGIDAPLKISGDLPGAKIKTVGPMGEIEKDTAIVAKRHLHLPPAEAEKLHLNNSDNVSVEINTDRKTTYSNIVVRVKENYSTSIHLDTDEANAAGISGETSGELIL